MHERTFRDFLFRRPRGCTRLRGQPRRRPRTVV